MSFPDTDRVLRPMILTKQLELGQNLTPVVSPQTPRNNLAKELEKYNRPEASAGTGAAVKTENSNLSPTPPLVKVPKRDSVRPSILRRPSAAKKPPSQSPQVTSPESPSVSSPQVGTTVTGLAATSLLKTAPKSVNLPRSVSYTRSVTNVTIPNPLISKTALPMKSHIHGTIIPKNREPKPLPNNIYIHPSGQEIRVPEGFVLVPKFK